MSEITLTQDDRTTARAARESGVCHAAARAALIEVRGTDAARYLEAMCTRDLSGLDAGDVRYAALVDDRARYVADFWIWRPGERWWLEAERGVATALVDRLRGFAVADDVEIEPLPDLALFHLEGPHAPQVAHDLLGVDPQAAGAGEVSGRAIRAWARRSRYGEEGFTLALAPAEADRLAAAARAHGLVLASPEVQDSLRLEAGRVRGGVDVTEKDLLPEAGLWGAVSLDKGCFPGQEIVRRIVTRGELKRRLVGFVEEPAAPEGSGSLEATSVAFSALQGRRIGLGWVRAQDAAPGTSIRVLVRGPSETLCAGRVAALPLAAGPRSASPDVPGERVETPAPR